MDGSEARHIVGYRPPLPERSSGLRTLVPLVGVLIAIVALGLGVHLAADARAPEPDRIAALSARAERLRGLTLLRPVEVERVQRSTLGERLARLIAAEPDPDLPGSEDALHLMGLLDPDVALADVYSAGFAQGVLGFYDPETQRLSLVETGEVEASGGTILHEIVHAIQDQVFTLESDALSPDDDDAALAARALVEGDATEVELRFLGEVGLAGVLGELGGGLAHIQGGPSGGPGGVPFLNRVSAFPYEVGPAFVTALRARGGQQLLDRAFTAPPRTTLAVLEPDRYDTPGDVAERVAMPGTASGMRRVLSGTFGAADLLALTEDREAALAWRGGQLAVDRAAKRGVVTIRLVSDDAQRTALKLQRAIPAIARVSVRGRTVTLTVTGALPAR